MGLNCREYFRAKGIGPIHVVTFRGEDIHFVGPYRQCYVCFLGNVALAIIPLSIGIYFWKNKVEE